MSRIIVALFVAVLIIVSGISLYTNLTHKSPPAANAPQQPL